MCFSAAFHHSGWIRSISRLGTLSAWLIASAIVAMTLPASCTGIRKLAVHRSSCQMLSTISRSAPCQETCSRRDGERWSLNQASETRGLDRDMAMTISVLAGDHPVYRDAHHDSTGPICSTGRVQSITVIGSSGVRR